MKNYILLGFALISAHLAFAQNNRSKAEVFIQIQDRGNFTVNLDNESISSSKGRFRFFDIFNAAPTLSISQGDKVIYSKRIDVRGEERLIFNYDLRLGLKIYKSLPIYRNGKYALDNFDQVAEAYNTGIVPPRGENNGGVFQTLQIDIKKASFDDEKIKIIQAYIVNSNLSTAQAALLLKTFSFDEKKLSIAKDLAPVITDPQNYYTLKDSFDFLSTKNEFLNFLTNNKSARAERGMRPSTFEQLKTSVKSEAFDDNKTKLIQIALQSSAPSTAQIGELLKLYTFDDKALACAKMTYNFVSDKQRFFTLKDVFKFKSNQDLFLEFLAQK